MIVRTATAYDVANALNIPTDTVARIMTLYADAGYLTSPKRPIYELRDWLSSRIPTHTVADDGGISEEIKRCLASFTTSLPFNGVRPEDLLRISKELIPPIYLVEDDFLYSQRHGVLRNNYPDSEITSIMEFTAEVYHQNSNP